MTGSFSQVHEETYKNHLIEIYCFMTSMPGMVSYSHFNIRVDGKELEGDFDKWPNEDEGTRGFKGSPPPDPERSEALRAAKDYCDRLEGQARIEIQKEAIARLKKLSQQPELIRPEILAEIVEVLENTSSENNVLRE